MGAPKGNRNRAKDNVYHRRVVSLSGPEFDEAMKCLKERNVVDPSDKEILREMSALDWSQFGIKQETTANADQYDCEQAERSALAEIRADYQWIKECESVSIETLSKIIVEGPYVPNEDGSQPKPEEVNEPFRTLHPRRHHQAKIVLEARIREEEFNGR